uniref:Ras-related protein Rab-43 n=1 Tax=Strongyloides venezuelensis TaxID=75913 RepID=A0A0K0EXA6_STRVS
MVSTLDDAFDYLFKIVLIGDMGVGKTCVVQRFKSGTFIEQQGTTIGVDFTMKTMIVDGKKIKLQIWDTGGQERFRTITQSYYRSANGIILCYDMTCKQSYESLQRWIDDVVKYAVPNVSKILIATKADKEDERVVGYDEGLHLSSTHSMCGFFEVSSKSNVNIEKVFYKMAIRLKNQYESGLLLDEAGNSFSIKTNETSSIPTTFNNCCKF